MLWTDSYVALEFVSSGNTFKHILPATTSVNSAQIAVTIGVGFCPKLVWHIWTIRYMNYSYTSEYFLLWLVVHSRAKKIWFELV